MAFAFKIKTTLKPLDCLLQEVSTSVSISNKPLESNMNFAHNLETMNARETTCILY